MRFVGIDPSLARTGLVVLDGEKTYAHSLKTDNRKSLYERQRRIAISVKNLLQRNDIVIFEDFGVSARYMPSGNFCERIELLGMLKLITPLVTRLPWLSISPTMLKSFATGKSSAYKLDVLEAVKTKWQAPVDNHDEADAFTLARYGMAVIENDKTFKKKIDKFEKYNLNKEHLAKIRFQLPAIISKK